MSQSFYGRHDFDSVADANDANLLKDVLVEVKDDIAAYVVGPEGGGDFGTLGFGEPLSDMAVGPGRDERAVRNTGRWFERRRGVGDLPEARGRLWS